MTTLPRRSLGVGKQQVTVAEAGQRVELGILRLPLGLQAFGLEAAIGCAVKVQHQAAIELLRAVQWNP